MTTLIQYWLFKSEPGTYSIHDLRDSPSQTDHWDGVRNYQARNYLRDSIKKGDRVLFYHSVTNPSVVGTAVVVKEGYPDHTSWAPEDPHFDPKSTPDTPRWFMVDIQLEAIFPQPIPLKTLRNIEGLEDMILLSKGSRLSIQPVSAQEFHIIEQLGQSTLS